MPILEYSTIIKGKAMNTQYSLSAYRSHDLSIEMRTSSGDVISMDFQNETALKLQHANNKDGSQTDFSFASMHTSGINPAPIPCILCGPGLPPDRTGEYPSHFPRLPAIGTRSLKMKAGYLWSAGLLPTRKASNRHVSTIYAVF